MKTSEFRKLIREEVRKVLREATDPVQNFVDQIVDLAGSGAGQSSGLQDPSGKKMLDGIVKNIKAQNLMSKVDAALVNYINNSESGAFTEDDYFALQRVGFKLVGIDEDNLDSGDDYDSY